MITNVLLAEAGAARFNWGRGDLMHTGEVRDRYLAALRAADGDDYPKLFAFVRS